MRYTATRRMAIIATNNLSSGIFIGSVLAAGLLFVCAVAFFIFERNAEGSTVDSLWDGILWVSRTVLQGEPAFEPLSAVGKFLFYVVVITGVGIIALVTATIASKIIQWVMRKDTGMGRAK